MDRIFGLMVSESETVNWLRNLLTNLSLHPGFDFTSRLHRVLKKKIQYGCCSVKKISAKIYCFWVNSMNEFLGDGYNNEELKCLVWI